MTPNSTRWLKTCTQAVWDTSIPVTATNIARHMLSKTAYQPGYYALNIGPPPATLNPVDEETKNVLCELLKCRIYLFSKQTRFARTVWLSKNADQIFCDVIASDNPRSRNYFARKTGDAAQIPHDIVHCATCFAITYNCGAIPPAQGEWYPPIQVTFPSERDLNDLFRLLAIIFTYEKVMVSWRKDSTGNWCVTWAPFETERGARFIIGLYERSLIKKLSISLAQIEEQRTPQQAD